MSKCKLGIPTEILLILCHVCILCSTSPANLPCGYPGKPAFGKLVKKSSYYTHGDVVRYECQIHYSLFHKGSDKRTCNNGSWTFSLPVCNDNIAFNRKVEVFPTSVSAPMQNIVDNVKSTCFDLKPVSEKERRSVRISLEEIRTVRQINLYFENNMHFNVTIFIENSLTKRRKVCGSKEGNYIRSVVSLYCYPNIGQGDIVEIEDNSVKNKPFVVCEVQVYALPVNTTCGLPETPAFGWANYTSGNTVKYNCQSGYILEGPYNRTCYPTGTATYWPNGTIPTCVKDRRSIEEQPMLPSTIRNKTTTSSNTAKLTDTSKSTGMTTSKSKVTTLPTEAPMSSSRSTAKLSTILTNTASSISTSESTSNLTVSLSASTSEIPDSSITKEDLPSKFISTPESATRLEMISLLARTPKLVVPFVSTTDMFGTLTSTEESITNLDAVSSSGSIPEIVYSSISTAGMSSTYTSTSTSIMQYKIATNTRKIFAIASLSTITKMRAGTSGSPASLQSNSKSTTNPNSISASSILFTSISTTTGIPEHISTSNSPKPTSISPSSTIQTASVTPNITLIHACNPTDGVAFNCSLESSGSWNMTINLWPVAITSIAAAAYVCCTISIFTSCKLNAHRRRNPTKSKSIKQKQPKAIRPNETADTHFGAFVYGTSYTVDEKGSPQSSSGKEYVLSESFQYLDQDAGLVNQSPTFSTECETN